MYEADRGIVFFLMYLLTKKCLRLSILRRYRKRFFSASVLVSYSGSIQIEYRAEFLTYVMGYSQRDRYNNDVVKEPFKASVMTSSSLRSISD